jgi:hypothetical protein
VLRNVVYRQFFHHDVVERSRRRRGKKGGDGAACAPCKDKAGLNADQSVVLDGWPPTAKLRWRNSTPKRRRLSRPSEPA